MRQLLLEMYQVNFIAIHVCISLVALTLFSVCKVMFNNVKEIKYFNYKMALAMCFPYLNVCLLLFSLLAFSLFSKEHDAKSKSYRKYSYQK